jgi:hypothetical protein
LQFQLPFLHQHHGGHAGELLGHRHDLKNGIRGHRFAALDVAPAHGIERRDFAVPRHQRDGARNGLVLHQFAQANRDQLQAVGIEARLGRGLRPHAAMRPAESRQAEKICAWRMSVTR